MNKPKAILLADVHYSLNTLEVASKAVRMAIEHANDLHIPVIFAGDTHDTKANLRAECVNQILEDVKLCLTRPYVLVGNHCKVHEKSEAHALNFLGPYAFIIDEPRYNKSLDLMLIPYQHDPKAFLTAVGNTPPDKVIICHQGITGSLSGDYIQDKSAVDTDSVMGRRIISGHYHTRQTIQLPFNGTWDYIGNPYTLTYGEANDPPKGYQILYNDGSLEFIPTNLRKHVVLNVQYTGSSFGVSGDMNISDTDIVWVKAQGTKEQLAQYTKERLNRFLQIKQTFRLDLIPTDTTTTSDPRLNLSQGPLLDSLIDSLSATSTDRKERLKSLWKAL